MTLPDATLTELAQRALRIRHRIVRMCAGPQGGHLGGSLSLVEILVLVHFHLLPPLSQRPPSGYDRLILSKGHGALALYATLAEAGVLPESAIARYGEPGTDLGCHPTATTDGIEVSTGSLGHGLSFALGVAQAAALRGQSPRLYVVAGDGELQEGSMWEALMVGASLGLRQCTLIVDRNRLQLTAPTEDVVSLDGLPARLAAFGWDVRECDGHDLPALLDALTAPPADPGAGPRAVVANTVKGKGLPFLEGKVASHYATLGERQLQRCLRALGPPPPARERVLT